MKEKQRVLYISKIDFGMVDLNNLLSVFTLNNGFYPDVIEMTTEAFDNYLSLLLKPNIKDFEWDRENMSFNGVDVKEINNLKI